MNEQEYEELSRESGALNVMSTSLGWDYMTQWLTEIQAGLHQRLTSGRLDSHADYAAVAAEYRSITAVLDYPRVVAEEYRAERDEREQEQE